MRAFCCLKGASRGSWASPLSPRLTLVWLGLSVGDKIGPLVPRDSRRAVFAFGVPVHYQPGAAPFRPLMICNPDVHARLDRSTHLDRNYPFCGTIRGKENVFAIRANTRIEIEPGVASGEGHFRCLPYSSNKTRLTNMSRVLSIITAGEIKYLALPCESDRGFKAGRNHSRFK